MKTLEEYQEAVLRTASVRHSVAMEMAISSLGLTGEAGEFADMVKKHIGHGHELDREKAVKELGDVLWYVARLATLIGSSLEEVATENDLKLRKRYPNGFSQEASKARVDVEGAAQVYSSEGQLIAVVKKARVYTEGANGHFQDLAAEAMERGMRESIPAGYELRYDHHNEPYLAPKR